MFLIQPRKFLSSPYSKSCRIIFMGFKDFLLLKPVATLPTDKHVRLLNSCSCSKTLLLPCNCQKSSRICASPKHFCASYQSYSPYSSVPNPRPINDVDFMTLEKQLVVQKQLMILKQKLQEMGIEGSKCTPGVHRGLMCPRCKGGPAPEKSLYLIISEDGGAAKWTCFRAKCGWSGKTSEFATTNKIKKVKEPIRVIDEKSLELEPLGNEDFATTNKITKVKKRKVKKPIRVLNENSLELKPLGNEDIATMNKITKVKKPKVKKPIRVIDEKSLGLKPLGNEVLADYAERMISAETLQRNGVMQKKAGRNQIAIAFPYRRNGELINCKYRHFTIPKRYWQEVSTEKIFYGLDDIKGASEIIIVDGEMDKLSMEEAGFKNCVSVPNGAPLPKTRASKKKLPSEEEDTKYQYLRNCKDYTAKASRIILATDSDPHGQALAEELARRFGRERCWRVEWPKKNDTEFFKDANEVLQNLGADALRDAIGKAKSYHVFNDVDVVTLEKQLVDQKKLMILKQKLQEIGIDGSECTPGQHHGLICPKCNDVAPHEKSLYLNISEDGGAAKWTCFRAKCGWSGNTHDFATMNKITKVKKPIRVLNEKSLELEPLGNEDFATTNKFTEVMKPTRVLNEKSLELEPLSSEDFATKNKFTEVKKPTRVLNEKSLELEPLSSEDFATMNKITKVKKPKVKKPIRVLDEKSSELEPLGNEDFATMNKIMKVKKPKVKKPIRVLDEKSLELEPLGNELLAYFAERMISGETLLRNGVMQKKTRHLQIAIAFPYRRNGELVSCKYRLTKPKKFWQESSTEKIFYGLDDIKGASDIIIVEGEIDKLSMEEAGFRNCVSVPDGAPLPKTKVSKRILPLEEEDTKHQYVRNCKDYTAKASRIILATDSDPPGQALAEELARRFGRERCWRVEWPKKNDTEFCKDANEVLQNLGADALRDAIGKAKSYHMQIVD